MHRIGRRVQDSGVGPALLGQATALVRALLVLTNREVTR